VTVRIVAEAPAAACLPGLAPLLAPDARARLQRLLIARAARWAVAAARGPVELALAGAADAALATALPRGVRIVAGAGDPVAGSGPVLVAGAAWPRLGPEHAAAAWADLDAGAGAGFGPALDGGAYLVGLAEPDPELAILPQGPAGLPRAIEAARARGREVGLLRHERALADPDDAAAFLADPLLESSLRDALSR
jgi:glycosyltransferase A (GT-A) superfamily protein (DUF2064 family)